MRGLWAVREWQVFICIVGRSVVPGCVFLNAVFIPLSKKKVRRQKWNTKMCLFFLPYYVGMIWIHIFPLATQNLAHFSVVPLLYTCCFPKEPIRYFLDVSRWSMVLWPNNSSKTIFELGQFEREHVGALGSVNSNSSRQLVYYVVVKCLSLAVSRDSRASFSLCFIDACLRLLILQCVLFGLIQLISLKLGVSPNIHYKNGCLGHWALGVYTIIYIYINNIFIALWSYSYTVYILLEILWWEDGLTGQKHDFKSWWFHTCCHRDVQLGSP